MNKEINYIEVKQMSEILAHYRGETRKAAQSYKLAVGRHYVETDNVIRMYTAKEVQVTRSHLQNMLKIWHTVQKDYHWHYDGYMKQCRSVQDAWAQSA